MLSLNLLGSFSITRDGEPLSGFISNKVQALLVYLAVTQQTHRRDALATLLWANVPEKVAKHSLRQALSNLRKIVPEGFEITRQTVGVIAATSTSLGGVSGQAGFQIDTQTFTSHLEAGNDAQAAELYHGDFLTGFFIADAPDFEAWQIVQREYFHRLAFDLFDRLQRRSVEQVDLVAAIDYARRLLLLEPWHEATHRQLMRLLAQRGDYAGGLAQFAACKKLLQTELGVEPELATQQLYERIAAARNRPMSRRQSTYTTLIGRDQEVANLSQLLLRNVRLLTITGPGGFGKTSLALQLADNLRLMWLDGVYVVPLASVNSVAGVVRAIVQTIGLDVQGEADLLPQLCQYLADREVLLLLDNCEQLVSDDFAHLVQELLDIAPLLSILLTSRERVGMMGEQVFALEGLAEQEAAANLFVSAARRQQIDFVPDETATNDIAAICDLVGNVPLALELAASQIDLYTPKEIGEAIAAGVASLTTAQRNVPERQRSLATVFETSWTLLTQDERDLYAALSVFVDGFTLAAARAVAGATPSLMQALVNKSLLARKNQRWMQHPLLLQFSAEKLAQAPARQHQLEAAHADYFAQLLNENFADIQLIKQPVLRMISAELPNIDKAWHFALANNQISNVAVSFRPLAFYFDATNRLQEWQSAFRLALDHLDRQPDAPPEQQNPLLAGVLVAYATGLERSAAHADAHAVAQRSLAISDAFGFDEARYHATIIIGRTHYYLGRLQASIDMLRKAVSIAVERQDVHGHARALQSLGGSLLTFGEIDEAKTVLADALCLFDQVDDQRGVLYAKNMLGQIANMLEQDDVAWRYWNDVLANENLPNYHFLHGMIHNWIAVFHLRKGAFEEALVSAEKAQDTLKNLTFTSTYVDALVGAGMAATAIGNLDYAWEIEGRLQSLLPKLASPIHYRHTEALRAMLLLRGGQTAQGERLINEVLTNPSTGWMTKKLLEKGTEWLYSDGQSIDA